MDKYEKTISLKTIWTTIVRRWYIFFVIFIPITIISYIVTDNMLTKSFISNASISRGAGASISTAQYNVMQTYFIDATEDKEDPKKSGAIAKTIASLSQEQIIITASEIRNGLSFNLIENYSASFTVSFTYKNQAMTQLVLKTVTEFAVENMNNSGIAEFKNSTIVSSASVAIKNSKERTYFLIALAAGFVVAFGIPFVDEIISDEVYDKYDIESLGCSAYEVKATTKKKEA